jgi:2-polyprenyl-3-methyl-5-hydroxy-6-metoxy-1,4-benzoquinol methylase
MSATSPSANQEFYDTYHRKNTRTTKIITDSNFTYFFHLRALKPFLAHLEKMDILDVGCGVGTLALYLAAHKAKSVLGIDLSARAIALASAAQTTLKLRNLTFKRSELKPDLGQFDLIIASEIIEHVPHPNAFVQNLRDNLKPGGTLLLSTPYAHNWLRDHGKLQKHDEVAGHLRIYDEKTLLRLFPTTDWTVESLTLTEGPVRMLLFTTPLGWLIYGLKGILVPIFHFFDDLIAKRYGKHDMLLIVKKKS